MAKKQSGFFKDFDKEFGKKGKTPKKTKKLSTDAFFKHFDSKFGKR